MSGLQSKSVKKLPEFLKKYFWDVEFAGINPEKRRIYILRRILEYGDEKAVAWMWKNFKKSEIKDVLFNFRGHSQKSANFWTLLLNIPREKVLCLKKRLPEGQKKLWPY